MAHILDDLPVPQLPPGRKWVSLQPAIPPYDDPGFDTARRAWLAWWEFGKAMGFTGENGAAPDPSVAFPLNFPPPRGEPPAVPAIFVPTRDVPGATPSRLADLQHVLNAATIQFDGMVDGKFVPLPPGAKVVLPSHPGREWIRIPPVMADPHYERIVTARREWGQVWPGLECLLSSFGGVNEDAQATIVLRLARPAEDSR